MKNTLKNFTDRQVFIINYNGDVEQLTYAEYLSTYHNDDTTSPRGVENRRQVVAILFDSEGDRIDYSINNRADLVANEEEGEELKWGIWNWGVGGNHGRIESISNLYDTQEEAEIDIFEGFEYSYQNGNYNHPQVFDTFEEAEYWRVEANAEAMGVDKDVFLSIERKAKKVEARRAELAKIAEQKRQAERALVFEKYKNSVAKVEGESYKETEARLSASLPQKIDSSVFHKIVKAVRNG